MTEYERLGLVFTKTRVYKFGHCTKYYFRHRALFHLISPIIQQPGQAGVLCRLSLVSLYHRWAQNRYFVNSYL
jgi:hypothetical protein